MVRRKRGARKHLQDFVGVKLGHVGKHPAPRAASQHPHCTHPHPVPDGHPARRTRLPTARADPCTAPTGTGTHASLSGLPPMLSPLAVGVEAPPGTEEGGGVQAPLGAALHGAAACPRPSRSLGGAASAPAPPPAPAFRAAAPPRGRPRGGRGGKSLLCPCSSHRPPPRPGLAPSGVDRGCGRTELSRRGGLEQPDPAALAASEEPCAPCKRPLKFQTSPNEGRSAGGKREASEEWWSLGRGKEFSKSCNSPPRFMKAEQQQAEFSHLLIPHSPRECFPHRNEEPQDEDRQKPASSFSYNSNQTEKPWSSRSPC